MTKSRVVEYGWNEKTEMATLLYDDGRTELQHQPIKAPKRYELRDSYYANLMLWIRLEHGR